MQGKPFSFPALPTFNGLGRDDPLATAAYAEAAGIYRMLPAAVVMPSTSRALTEVTRWAAGHHVPLIPRGAGSGMAGGNLGSGVLVDLTALDGAPLRLDAASRSAWAGAAVTHRALSEDARRLGLQLPPDPSSARFATLGGMLSTNASGPRSIRAGSVRRWVQTIDFVTAEGNPLTLRRGARPPRSPEVERFERDVEPAIRAARETVLARFPKTRKNSSGYALDAWLASGDLIDLIVGSEGTLGFITGAEWRLEPIPAAYAGLRAALRSPDALAAVVPLLRELDPSALEYLDATFLRFVGKEEATGGGLLMLELEGDNETGMADRILAASRILAPHAEEIREGRDRAELEELWAIRHAASPMLASLGESRRSLQIIEDACVPVSAIGSYMSAVRRAGEKHQIELVMFGHVGDGNIHVNVLPDVARPGWKEQVIGLFEEVTEAVLSVGGTLSGEHGDGRLRAGQLERVYGAEVVALFRRVKQAFDPLGIMNPGVKIPAPEDKPFEHLKVGADSVVLPARIEAGLRQIERSAGYAQSRLDLAGNF